jgi:hypothetical protein
MERTNLLNSPLKPGQVWDAGLNMEGAMNQCGRWGVKREAHKIIAFYHFFFPKCDTTMKTFTVDEEEAAKEYARQCCEEKTIPNRK